MITFTLIYPKICCMSNENIQEPCQCDVLYEEHLHTNRSSLTCKVVVDSNLQVRVVFSKSL